MQNYTNHLNNGISVREGQDEYPNQLYWEPEGQNTQQFPYSGISSGFLFMQEDPQTWYQNPSTCENLSFNQDQINFFSPHDDLIHHPIPTTSSSSSELIPVLPPYLETAPQSFTGLSKAASSSWPTPTARTFTMVNPRVHVAQLFSGGFESTGIVADVAGNMSAGASSEPPVPANDVNGKRIEIVEAVDDTPMRKFAKLKIAKKIQRAERRRKAEKRRRDDVNDRVNAVFGLTPDCKGSLRDKYDMVINHLLSMKEENLSQKQEILSLQHEKKSLEERHQYAETVIDCLTRVDRAAV